MTDQFSKIIEDNPIGKGLGTFHALFGAICEGASISRTPDAVERLSHKDLQNLTLILLTNLQVLPASRLLRSSGRSESLFSNLSRLDSAVSSNDFDFDRIIPLLKAALTDNPDNALIWKEIYNTVTESTPPPQSIASLQTPWLLRFVTTVLGFLWMSGEELGFNPTIITANNKRFIEIERDGSIERLVINKVMRRAHCIAGRATTYWRAHFEEDPQTPLVIKDLWQFVERDEEGELLHKVTSKGVVNVARYHYHKTVSVCGNDNNIRNGVRKGLDVIQASNYRPGRSVVLPSTGASALRKGRSSNSKVGQKRSSSQTRLPPSKRPCSESPTKTDRSSALSNRIYWCIILRDYSKPIYEASSRVALLSALEGCIKGHESLYKAGFLYRDISINNLMINEDKKNPSWPSFLIDLDLTIKEERQTASGAIEKTGTRAFMAVGVLLGEQHSFMYDLESFFWVLFLICIHYDGPGKDIGPTAFENWNYENDYELARSKKGQVNHEGDFIKFAKGNFTPYYQPLIPWVNRLRKAVFPNGRRWEREDGGLYVRMRQILQEAQEDPKVAEL
ncbi:hypothetical protein OQA88_13248 [Cercophora sp. LCS_1]